MTSTPVGAIRTAQRNWDVALDEEAQPPSVAASRVISPSVTMIDAQGWRLLRRWSRPSAATSIPPPLLSLQQSAWPCSRVRCASGQGNKHHPHRRREREARLTPPPRQDRRRYAR